LEGSALAAEGEGPIEEQHVQVDVEPTSEITDASSFAEGVMHVRVV
jgi:hypothetical protein